MLAVVGERARIGRVVRRETSNPENVQLMKKDVVLLSFNHSCLNGTGITVTCSILPNSETPEIGHSAQALTFFMSYRREVFSVRLLKKSNFHPQV
jgi:hypothetical protein